MAGSLVMEERAELMVSLAGGNVSLKTAHFLVPSVTSIDGPVAAPSLDSLSSAATTYKDLPFKVNYPGWRHPQEIWTTWVDKMHSLHHSTWKRAGILDAIMNSTFTIHRYDDLIFLFVEKWCPATNSFVFPWGEATITLEDMMVLGGYSVLGESVFSPPGNRETEEIEKKLLKTRSRITSSKARKAGQGRWITKFMDSQSEIEHEAFLAYWLSKFVFPFWWDTIGRSVIPIAVHLARGKKIALAPAVLASIYKSLTLLKAAVNAAKKSGTEECKSGVLQVRISAPLALLQVWIWERFPSLRPKPNPVGQNVPRLARWHKLKKLATKDMLFKLDTAAGNFQWRPYATAVGNTTICMDNGHWELMNSNSEENIEGLVRCLRTSELVSLEAGCIEQYLPHRVAMQFGLDQDLPGHVGRVNVNPAIAWSNYSRPIRDVKLYIPPRLSEPQVTARYSKWWKKLVLGWSGVTERDTDGNNAFEDSKAEVKERLFEGKLEDDFDPPPPGSAPKWKRVESGDSGDSEQFQNANFITHEAAPFRSPLSSTADNAAEVGLSGKSSSKCSKRKFEESSSWKTSDCNARIPPPKHSQMKASGLGIEIENIVVEVSSKGSYGKDQSQDNAQGKNHLSPTANNRNHQEVTVLVESTESEAKGTLAKEASEGRIDGVDMNTGVSPNQVRSSTAEATGLGLEERIRTVEKLCAWLEAGKLVCL
ncbi:UNVERIFIED_CONTAM: protein MAINTENANCE OF MERISTEMS [Sesamum calycinum]|uniref:Protein MAINTENANCE OF MERISTEMS n=1 Tax=Sesamum calycinum TaxID=2727403 RepID=A0AAW2Q4Y3_9LAMI